MKNSVTLVCIALIFASVPRLASADDEPTIKSMLFQDFTEGFVVLSENMAKVAANLNYDLYAERMLYLEPDKTMLVLDPSSVAVVVIDGLTFYPTGKGNAFYERIDVANDKEYYISHKIKIISMGKSVAYGGFSQTASVGGMAITSASGSLYLLGPKELKDAVDNSSILIKNGKKYEQITSMKILLIFFKDKQKELELYASEKKIDFKNATQVKQIVEYAFSL